MDNTLSSIGVFNADFSNITSDNTTIFSSLNVSGILSMYILYYLHCQPLILI